MSKLSLVLATTLLLSGCTGILASATGPGPVGKPSHERTLSKSLQDIEIQNTAEINIYKADARFRESNLTVTSFYGTVLLVGQVPAEELKSLAEKTVRDIEDVKQVYNEVRVSEPTYYLARANDGVINTKVKSTLLFTEGVPYGRIKIVTEDGIVYLMGKLTRSEADLATSKIRGVSGVQKIVKIVDYVDGTTEPSPATP